MRYIFFNQIIKYNTENFLSEQLIMYVFTWMFESLILLWATIATEWPGFWKLLPLHRLRLLFPQFYGDIIFNLRYRFILWLIIVCFSSSRYPASLFWWFRPASVTFRAMFIFCFFADGLLACILPLRPLIRDRRGFFPTNAGNSSMIHCTYNSRIIKTYLLC